MEATTTKKQLQELKATRLLEYLVDLDSRVRDIDRELFCARTNPLTDRDTVCIDVLEWRLHDMHCVLASAIHAANDLDVDIMLQA